MIKRDRKASKQSDDHTTTPTTKLLRRYPVTNNIAGENPESLVEHGKAIEKELAKKKPRDAILLPLMKSTYGDRRIYILNVACSVSDLLVKYPALSRPAVVCSSTVPANVYYLNPWLFSDGARNGVDL